MKNEKTSKRVASEASDILRDPHASAKEKSVAGSALTQAPDHHGHHPHHGGPHCEAPHHKASAAHAGHHGATAHHEPPKKKGGLGWLLWLLLAVLAALLLWWLLGRGCAHKEKVAETVQTVAPVKAAANTYDLTLPDGHKLIVKKGSHVDQLVTFLKSDRYKNADEAYLKTHWFEFEDIDFKFNSPTEFEEGSFDNLKNIAGVLKYFPNAKIRIGGNADHKDRGRINMEISKERAVTIKNHLVENGIAANRVSTEGFGDETAVIPATATDKERAPDRDFAMRFMK